jgi:protoporphyrinogen oxidase
MSPSHSEYTVCIVGAGASGLTAAYQLLKAGARVLVIERDARTGGLAKSHNYDGHIFDTGPKRFHTDDPIVVDFLEEISAGGLLRIPRSTEVHFLGRYFDWPLRIQDVWRMPIGLAVRSVLDLLRKKEVTDPASFHQYIRSRYGEALYRTFFEPYTGKFLRWDVEDIHSDWASTGINRTVVDSRISANTATDLIKNLLLPPKIKTEFLYPAGGGFGGFYDRLLEVCQRSENFQLLLNERIGRLADRGTCVEAETRGGAVFTCEHLLWTGNLNDLSLLIGSDDRLPYLNTVFYNVVCRAADARRRGAQWIYVSNGDTLVSRLTCMNEFAPYTCPPGYYNFICEVTDSQRDPLYFRNPQEFTDVVLDELVKMRFLNTGNGVEAVHINPVVDTYPIYHRGYLKQFGLAAARAKAFSKRVRLLGRSGAFWYNNSDHSIRFAMETVRALLGRSSGDFDFRGYFGGASSRANSPQGK